MPAPVRIPERVGAIQGREAGEPVQAKMKRPMGKRTAPTIMGSSRCSGTGTLLLALRARL